MPPRLRSRDLSPQMRSFLGDWPPAAPVKRAKVPRAPSPLEESFRRQASDLCLPLWVEEHRFDASRRWRFDFAWPALMLAVEVEGGTRSGGRHTRGDGYANDCEKYNAATLQGWRVLRFTADHLRQKRGAMSSAMTVLVQALQRFRAIPVAIPPAAP